MIELTESNFVLYAAHHYDNPSCFDDQEFQADLKRFVYIKRLIKRHINGSELKTRLLLNHIVMLVNVFGPTATTKMLFLKLYEYEPQIKPFLEYVGIMPDNVVVNGTRYYRYNGNYDVNVVKELTKI